MNWWSQGELEDGLVDTGRVGGWYGGQREGWWTQGRLVDGLMDGHRESSWMVW